MDIEIEDFVDFMKSFLWISFLFFTFPIWILPYLLWQYLNL